jgi:hypothetical protein
MRRIVVVLVLVLAAGIWPSSQGVAAVQAAPAPGLQADFNNDGAADLAIGVPFEWVGAVQDAGAVHVLYGSAGGLQGPGSQFFTQDSPGVPGTADLQDNFGFGLASGDFDQDGFADLAAGAAGEDGGPGAVSVLFGSPAGLTRAGGQLFTQVGGAAEGIDRFGASLAAADFDHDGFADLAAGAPFETLGSIREAGAVSVLYGWGGGLTRVGGQLFTQNSPGLGSSAEALDNFGLTLATGGLGPATSSAAASGTRSRNQNTMPNR